VVSFSNSKKGSWKFGPTTVLVLLGVSEKMPSLKHHEVLIRFFATKIFWSKNFSYFKRLTIYLRCQEFPLKTFLVLKKEIFSCDFFMCRYSILEYYILKNYTSKKELFFETPCFWKGIDCFNICLKTAWDLTLIIFSRFSPP